MVSSIPIPAVKERRYPPNIPDDAQAPAISVAGIHHSYSIVIVITSGDPTG